MTGSRPLTSGFCLLLPSLHGPDRAINSLQRVPRFAFAPLGRGATTEAITTFGIPPQQSLTLLGCQPLSISVLRSSFGTWRVPPLLQQDWFSWSVEGRGRRTLPAHWVLRTSHREPGEVTGRSGCGTGEFTQCRELPRGPVSVPACSAPPATTSGAGAGPWGLIAEWAGLSVAESGPGRGGERAGVGGGGGGGLRTDQHSKQRRYARSSPAWCRHLLSTCAAWSGASRLCLCLVCEFMTLSLRSAPVELGR